MTLPGDGQPTNIEIITGNAQAGIAGSVLPLALVVKVTDDLGRPVAGQSVGYTVMSGGGQVSPASMQTGADGRASATWTLGPNAGDQGVVAQAVGGGAPDNLTQSFTAVAVAGSGSLVAAVSGDDQSAPVNSALAAPLIVRVSDGNGNPVSGITIQWTVQNGGSISPETVVTGGDGLATASRVLGPTAGQQAAQASGDGLAGSPVTFVQTALPSNPTALTEVSGNGQTAPAGFEVAEDLVVRLTDDNGNGVGGRAVAWVVPGGGGTVTPANSTTDPTGLARTRWTLGGSAGTITLNAVFSGLPPVPFTATASADVPTTLAIASGDNQSAAGGAALANPLAVKVTDANNNPVENVSVAWTAVGGGTVSGGTSATDAQGIARIIRTLGTTPGAYTTTAEVPSLAGSPVTFNSTATAGAAAKIVIVTPPGATAANGAPLAPQPVVQVQDAAGNNVGPAGRPITASLLSPPVGSSLNGDTSKDTDANGQAVFTDLNVTGPVGTYTIRFRSGALVEARADVSVTIGPVSGATSLVEATPASVAINAPSTITVTAKDAGGNPVQGATVTLQAGGSGNSLTQPGGPTDANGQATATFSSTGLGPHTITGSVGATTFTDNAIVTVTAGPPASIAIQAGEGQSAPVGTAVATDPAVIVRDAGNNPVSGIQVTFVVTTGGGSVTGGTATSNGSGIATVGSWILGPTAGTNNNTLTATADGAGITGNPVTFTATATGGPPTQITIATQPSATAQAGVAFATQPVVQLLDAGGNISPTAGVTITASVASGPSGATLSSATATTNGSGVATFAGLTIDGTVGSYTLSFGSGSLTAAVSNSISLSAGPAAALSFVQQPSSTASSNATITPAVVVGVADAFGNPTDALVHVSLNQTPGGTAILNGTVDVQSVSASATFSDLSVNLTGVYSLTAFAPGAQPFPSSGFFVGP